MEEADFTYIKQATGASAGNLSVQLSKLKDAEYISVEKSYRDNYPLTTCKITALGQKAFSRYVQALEDYIRVKKP